MWKTRFEVSSSHSNGVSRHRTLSSSSKLIHHYYTQPSPTVPRVREDSPSAILRPSPPSSIPNLDILPEEDEDIIPYEQPNIISITLRKQNSYQIVLPTILESHDHESMIDGIPNKSDINIISSESVDDRHSKYVGKLKPQESFVATNTNYNQITKMDIEKKNDAKTGFTLDKRINELLQQKIQRQTKSISSSADVEMVIPSTFKDISAFFENKTLEMKPSEQKKMVRAKRSLPLSRYIHKDLSELKNISSTEEEANSFCRQIKRIKRIHKDEFNIEERSIDSDVNAKRIEHEERSSEQLLVVMDNISLKKTLLKRWFILLIFIIIMFGYFYLSNITDILSKSLRLKPFVHLQNYLFSRRFIEPIHTINNNCIYQYGQFVRNRFFSLLDLLVTYIGQMFFRVDKYEYKNNIVYVATSTYERAYDWFVHLFKKQYI